MKQQEVNRDYRCRICRQLVHDDEDPPTSAMQGYCNYHDDDRKPKVTECDGCGKRRICIYGEGIWNCKTCFTESGGTLEQYFKEIRTI